MGLRKTAGNQTRRTRCSADQSYVPDLPSSAGLSSVLRSEGQHIETLSYALWTLRRDVLEQRADVSCLVDKGIQNALTQLRELELARALNAAELSVQLGLSSDAALIEIANALSAPWSAPLVAHHISLAAAVMELDSLTAEVSHTLLTASQKQDDLVNQLVNQAVPRSLVWFLRSPANLRTS